MKRHHWHAHPGVRSGGQLTIGERAADAMRNGMGSWPFVMVALLFLGAWIGLSASRLVPLDNPQLTILNLILSCVAALQGAIILIAARRADQVSAELATHHYEEGRQLAALLDANTDLTADVRSLTQAVHDHLLPEAPDA